MTDSRLKYFAYGSNMSSGRFRVRIASAKSIGCAYLEDKKVVFNKRSMDGSGKANLADAVSHVTWGVLYEIDSQLLKALDDIEGGYDRSNFQVHVDGGTVEAVTYVSTDLAGESVAYDWYKELVLAGAREHNLPPDYIVYLEALPSRPQKPG